MTHDEVLKRIAALAAKAAEAKDSGDAMRFSQAACNLLPVFNALASK
jgi:hypothetical protein